MVWLPAVARLLAEVSATTLVSELEPCLEAKTPLKSVRVWSEEESVARCVPKLLRAVSWARRWVSCDFQGVSMACSIERI